MLPRTKKVAVEWLNRANSNLARATQSKLPIVYWEDMCFDAQQAAEKALKSLFIWHGKKFPFSHDIGELLEELEAILPDIPDLVREAKSLSDYAVVTRYPAWGMPVTEAEFKIALEQAKSVVEWVSATVRDT
jgi:HEPN domain-containing protein